MEVANLILGAMDNRKRVRLHKDGIDSNIDEDSGGPMPQTRVLKRPAARGTGDKCTRPAFPETGDPVHYREGVIYSDDVAKRFRCYYYMGDYVDHSVSYGASKRDAFAKALERMDVAYDSGVRPKPRVKRC